MVVHTVVLRVVFTINHTQVMECLLKLPMIMPLLLQQVHLGKALCMAERVPWAEVLVTMVVPLPVSSLHHRLWAVAAVPLGCTTLLVGIPLTKAKVRTSTTVSNQTSPALAMS